jgi:hypothetical protein
MSDLKVVCKYHARFVGQNWNQDCGVAISGKGLEIRSDGRPPKEIAFGEIEWAMQRVVGNTLSGVELYLTKGKTFFLNFEGDAVGFLKELRDVMPKSVVQLGSRVDFVRGLKWTDDWVKGKISNFRYLVWLNMVMGRSFHTESHYPIFPRVFSDYLADRIE